MLQGVLKDGGGLRLLLLEERLRSVGEASVVALDDAGEILQALEALSPIRVQTCGIDRSRRILREGRRELPRREHSLEARIADDKRKDQELQPREDKKRPGGAGDRRKPQRAQNDDRLVLVKQRSLESRGRLLGISHDARARLSSRH